MKKYSTRWLIGLAGLLVIGLGQASQSALAATPKNPSGITVSPAFQQITINLGESQHPVEFKITNNLTLPRTISLSTQDFNTLNESGGLFFVGTNPTQLEKKYGLSQWLSLPTKAVTIQPKQTVKVTINILNQPTLASGGHYGALMLALPTSTTAANGQNRVALKPVASSLLFVNKVGGDIHRLRLRGVEAKHSWLNLPGSVILDFGNTGNTHLVPRGIVTITGSGGRLISKGTINENSNLLLPERTRKFSVDLNQISRPIKPGHYLLTVNYRFDGYDKFATYRRSLLLILPLNLVAWLILAAGSVLAIYYLLRSSFKVKLLNRFRR